MPAPSRILGTRYRLGQILGEGGSGVVYEGTDLLLGRSVAVKCMKLGSALARGDHEESIDDFVSEARTIAHIKHPHIVDIHDVGLDEEGRPYFVMELVESSLGRMLKEHDGKLSVEDTLGLLLPLCGALACAHDLGIVHCDIKPENIAVRRVGRAKLRGKLLDFSIARRDQPETTTALVLGTPGYMAPEQICGQACTPRTDVWALAAVAYECISGDVPFASVGDTQLQLQRTAYGAAPTLKSTAPDVPLPLVNAIDRALSRLPERRFDDMRAFARALVSAAVQSKVRIPVDPDPIGLPDAPRWRAESGAATDALLPLDAEPPASAAEPGPRAEHVAQAEGGAPAVSTSSTVHIAHISRTSRLRRALALAGVGGALLLALGGWALYRVNASARVLSRPPAIPQPSPAAPVSNTESQGDSSLPMLPASAEGPNRDARSPAGVPTVGSSERTTPPETLPPSQRPPSPLPSVRGSRHGKPSVLDRANVAERAAPPSAEAPPSEAKRHPARLELQDNWEW